MESIKQFLKPDWRKILIAMIFFSASSYPFRIIVKSEIDLPYTENRWPESILKIVYAVGFPLRYLDAKVGINYINLFFGLLLWYFISCFLVSAWDKIRNKK